MLSLPIKERGNEKTDALRRRGFIPAVMYGRKDESTPIAVDGKVFGKIFKQAGESTLISLEGVGEEKTALIHEVSFDAVRGDVIHADFYLVAKGQKITVGVPLEFVGTSAAVKDKGGILVKVIHDLEVEVLPKDLPAKIEVDISKLANLEDRITVADLGLPETVVPQIPGEEVVAMISVASDEPEEPAEPVDLSQIETSVERGKKEEEAPADGDSDK